MSAGKPKVLPFPKVVGRIPRSDRRAFDYDALPANVEALIDHGHKRPVLEVSRSPELLIALCILRAVPDEVRREAKRQIGEVCRALPDDEIARTAMSLAARIF